MKKKISDVKEFVQKKLDAAKKEAIATCEKLVVRNVPFVTELVLQGEETKTLNQAQAENIVALSRAVAVQQQNTIDLANAVSMLSRSVRDNKVDVSFPPLSGGNFYGPNLCRYS